jgi:hypothetical protein
MAATQTEQLLAALPAGISAPPLPAPLPYLKPVEGTGYFQKTPLTQTAEPLVGEELLFTYCDVTDYGIRPFGNLFSSLRLPVSLDERTRLGTILAGTGLDGLQDVEHVVVVEVPADRYGEMLDGKSIELQLPLRVDGQNEVYTLYGGYYNFNTELNNQVSDSNPLSGYLGVEPTPENDYNSNIAYLFCNQIQPPKDTLTEVQLTSASVVVPARGSVEVLVPLVAATTYRCSALTQAGIRVKAEVAGAGLVELASLTLNGIGPTGTFRPRQAATKLRYFNDGYADLVLDNVVVRYDVTSSREWSSWSPLNRYPTQPNGVGKSIATLLDPNQLGFADEPVGLVYLDKGLLVLTHPTLVENLRRDTLSGAQCLEEPGLVDLVDCPATGGYTRLRYTGDDGTLARLSYRSVTTELTQTFTCMAGIGEFSQTTNPTYSVAYPDAAADQPVYITEVGLYNQAGELIAIAKTSEPLLKQANRPVLFTIYLRL